MVKFSEVEEAVSFLVKSFGLYNISKEGYVIHRIVEEGDDEYVRISVGTSKRPILLLKERIMDQEAVVVNPFNENASESNDSRWFYVSMAVGLNRRIIAMFTHLHDVLSHGDEPAFEVSPDMLRFSSKFKDFGDKELEYLQVISKNKLEFMNVWYDRKIKRATFRCGVFEEGFWEKFPGVTKKAKKIITEILASILNIDINKDPIEQLKELASSSDSIGVPKLDSMLRTYLKVYTRIGPYSNMVVTDDDMFQIDLTTLSYHIDNLEEYHSKTKWFAHQTTAKAEDSETVTAATEERPSVIPDNPRRAGMTTQVPTWAAPVQMDNTGVPDNPHRMISQHGQFSPSIGYANQQLMGQPMGHQQLDMFGRPQMVVGYANQQPGNMIPLY